MSRNQSASSGFIELSRADAGQSRVIVISQNTFNEGITFGQSVKIPQGNKTLEVFLKGSLTVFGVASLYALRDAINSAIEILEE